MTTYEVRLLEERGTIIRILVDANNRHAALTTAIETLNQFPLSGVYEPEDFDGYSVRNVNVTEPTLWDEQDLIR